MIFNNHQFSDPSKQQQYFLIFNILTDPNIFSQRQQAPNKISRSEEATTYVRLPPRETQFRTIKVISGDPIGNALFSDNYPPSDVRLLVFSTNRNQIKPF